MQGNTKPQGIRHDITKRNPDQVAAHKIVTSPQFKFFLGYGGSGGGKSFFWMDVVVERAMIAANSRHAIFRLTRNSCEKTLFDKTLHEVLDKAWPGIKDQPGFNISQSTMTVDLPNGSKLFFDGGNDLHPGERIESQVGHVGRRVQRTLRDAGPLIEYSHDRRIDFVPRLFFVRRRGPLATGGPKRQWLTRFGKL